MFDDVTCKRGLIKQMKSDTGANCVINLKKTRGRKRSIRPTQRFNMWGVKTSVTSADKSHFNLTIPRNS